MVALVNRYIGIPLVDYSDDFAAIIRATIGQAALDAFARFCSMLGVQLKDGKSKLGRSVISLGLLGSSPCTSNGGKLLISPPEEKRAKCPHPAFFLPQGWAHPSPLPWEVDWAIVLFSDVADWQVPPYADATPVSKFHRRVYPDRLPPCGRAVFFWREEVVDEFASRLAAPRPDKPRWAIFIDAATNPPMLCALFPHGDRASADLHTAIAARAPSVWP